MKYIGRKISIGFWKESPRGTPAAPTHWMPHTSLDFDEKFENVVQDGAVWSIVDSNETFNTKRWAEGWIEGDLMVENSWLLFLALMGQISSVETSGTGAFDHTFTLLNTNEHPSLTISTSEWNGDTQFALGMIEELTVSANVWEIAKLKMSFKSKMWKTITVSSNFNPTDKTLLARHGTLSIWGTDVKYKSFEITFKKNLVEDYAWGWIDVNDILNQQFEVEWNVEFDYDNNTFKDYAINSEQKEVVMVIQDPNTTIGVEDHPTLSITLPKVSFTSWDRNKSLNEIVNQTLDFKAHYNLATDSIGSILLRNETASY